MKKSGEDPILHFRVALRVAHVVGGHFLVAQGVVDAKCTVFLHGCQIKGYSLS